MENCQKKQKDLRKNEVRAKGQGPRETARRAGVSQKPSLQGHFSLNIKVFPASQLDECFKAELAPFVSDFTRSL